MFIESCLSASFTLSDEHVVTRLTRFIGKTKGPNLVTKYTDVRVSSTPSFVTSSDPWDFIENKTHEYGVKHDTGTRDMVSEKPRCKN